ncbi:hypothetical protein J6590_076788 [Homalodisca vitripennis]|nr:hypothetical protein J6590_076788 [Homalodisca vitripennis]
MPRPYVYNILGPVMTQVYRWWACLPIYLSPDSRGLPVQGSSYFWFGSAVIVILFVLEIIVIHLDNKVPIYFRVSMTIVCGLTAVMVLSSNIQSRRGLFRNIIKNLCKFDDTASSLHKSENTWLLYTLPCFSFAVLAPVIGVFFQRIIQAGTSSRLEVALVIFNVFVWLIEFMICQTAVQIRIRFKMVNVALQQLANTGTSPNSIFTIVRPQGK